MMWLCSESFSDEARCAFICTTYYASTQLTMLFLFANGVYFYFTLCVVLTPSARALVLKHSCTRATFPSHHRYPPLAMLASRPTCPTRVRQDGIYIRVVNECKCPGSLL